MSRKRSLVIAVGVFTALAVALVWGLSLSLQAQLRERVLAGEEARSLQLAEAMGGQIDAYFNVLDGVAQSLREGWQAGQPRFAQAVNRQMETLPPGLVLHITVADADGTLVFSSDGGARGTYLGDRPYFPTLREGPDQLLIGPPVRSRLSGNWVFDLVRPLQRDGVFDGAVILKVSTDYVARRLGRMTLSDQDVVGLLNTDGYFLAHSQRHEALMGMAVPADQPFLQHPELREGTYREQGLDGVSRLYGWVRLPHRHGVVAVGLSQATVLAPLQPAQQQALWLTGLLTLALLGGGAAGARLLWRIEKSETRLKDAQRMARLGHWQYDIRSQTLTWSDEVWRIFGQSPDHYRPTYEGYEALIHPDDKPALQAAFDTATSRRTPLDEVHRAVLNNGTVRHVRLLCRMDFEGDVAVRYHGTVQDITELREAQLALVRLNVNLERNVEARTTDLQALNRDLESFTYSVAHDLRTPLRSIHGFATLMQEMEASRLSDEGRDFLQRIQEGARRMGLLITDLLSLSQHSRALICHDAVDLSELAHAVVADLERGEPGRQVQWQIEEGLTAQADFTLMRVVLQNLLGNAWKYTGQTPNAVISFTRQGEVDGQVEFCVRDNGAGFNMAYVDQLFQPFKRLHAHHQFEGSGIGLATVSRVVQRHGGRVRGEGAVGQGACFCFSLPQEPMSLPRPGR